MMVGLIMFLDELRIPSIQYLLCSAHLHAVSTPERSRLFTCITLWCLGFRRLFT